jgi:hypothetical protein
MKNILISFIILMLITCAINCNGNKSEDYMKENNNFKSPEQLWSEYLSALKTGEEEYIKAVSLNGYNFTRTWLDANKYKQMCIDLGNGWSKSDLNINNVDDSSAIGYLKVNVETQAYFYFGPTILIQFKMVNNNWEIEYISFEGD